MSKNTKISVVTICYNPGPETLERTMCSVLDQDYDNLEYIIIDGGSTDGSVEIIKKYASRLAHWVSEPDKGIYDAMTKGVEAATGKYINFMNAGDTFFDNHVLSQVWDGKDYDEDVVYGSTILNFNGGYKPHHPSDLKSFSRKWVMPFGHQSSFTKVSTLKARPFDQSYPHAADYVFFRDLYEAGGTFRKVRKYISIFDQWGVSSGMTLDYYFENCRAFRVKPSLKEFFDICMWYRWRHIRYCKLKFRVKHLWKPEKYSVHIEDFPQLQDEKDKD
ncbi:MAG: glycosyltransferase [Duncaniella sp.]|nr:glycosyltransferase [Duncaniella sp.]